MKKQRWNVANVREDVAKAISQYCRDNEITQGKYLATDKRIKEYLSTGQN